MAKKIPVTKSRSAAKRSPADKGAPAKKVQSKVAPKPKKSATKVATVTKTKVGTVTKPSPKKEAHEPEKHRKANEVSALKRKEEVAKLAEQILKPKYLAPHGIVRARAGTGKTFTLVLGVAKMYGDKLVNENKYTWRADKDGKGQFEQELLTLWEKVEKEMAGGKLDPQTEKPPKIVPSRQQQEVWDFMALSKPRSICYVAFNASIVEEFSEKYDWLVKALDQIGVRLTFSTIHSLGNSACREYYKLRGWKAVNSYRVSDILSELWQVDLREVWRKKAETIQAIQELVALCKLTLTGLRPKDADFAEVGVLSPPTDEELADLAEHYGIVMEDREAVFRDVKLVLQRCREVARDGTGKIDFNDMIWLPVIKGLPVEKYDLLLVDEAQDLNRCQQELVLKAGRRIILVGDERQAIYGFAGADTDSIDRMEKLLSEKGGEHNGREVSRMALTVTRRCGKAIVQEANRFVEDFQAHETCPPGKVVRVSQDELEDGDKPVDGYSLGEDREQSLRPSYNLTEGDFVLCRVNAPLVRLAFKMLRAGKRVNIKGRDIGAGLKAFIKKSKAKEVGEFLDWLDRFRQEETERMKRRKHVDAEALVTLEDKCECLRTLCEGAFDLKAVYKNIDALFKGKVCPRCGKSYDEGTKVCFSCKDPPLSGEKYDKAVKLVAPAGTLCSSIHRAKGLEAKRVFILRPDLMPHPKAKSDWEKGQEANLQYVAITRAIDELIYVQKGGDNE